jgi:large subunit ribosomal protein L5
MTTLQEKYEKEVVPAMMKKFGYSSTMAVPRIEKIIVNTGFGKLVAPKTGDDQKKTIEGIVNDLSHISGQHAVSTRAKKSIAGFKLREGSIVGARATLRGKKMYDFLNRFISIVLPRSRDFEGISLKTLDKEGNCTIGIREHIFFPEISPEKVRNVFGLEVTITTTAKTNEEGQALLSMLGVPFTKSQDEHGK